MKRGRLKLTVLSLLAILLLSRPGYCAITADSDTDYNEFNNDNRTVSHTVAGTDTLLAACVACEGTSCPEIDTPPTYNGTSMIFGDEGLSDAGAQNTASCYYLVNPDTGTHDLVWDFGSPDRNRVGNISSWNGVKQTGQPEDTDNDDCTSCTTVTVSLVTSVADCLLIDSASNGNNNVHTPGSGQTELYDAGNSTMRGVTEYLIVGSADTYTQSTSSSSTNRLAQAGMAFSPVAAAGGRTRRFF